MRVRLKHEKLAALIRQSRLTQNRWAQKLSLSRGHLSDLVNGRHPYPTLRTRQKLLRGLGLEESQLFEVEPPVGMPAATSPHQVFLTRPMDVHDAREAGMTFLLWDIRKSLRNLIRQPLYALTILSTLVIGLALNATVFTLINRLLIEPLPFPDAGRIVILVRPGDTEGDLSMLDGRDLREGADSIEKLALFMPFAQFDLLDRGDPTRLVGMPVEPDFFEVLGAVPLLGRFLSREEHLPGGPTAVVISAGIWERLFARSPETIGAQLRLSDTLYTVVGVAPPEMALVGQSDLWVPIAQAAPFTLDQRGTNNLEALARLRPGASLETAAGQIDQISRRLAELYPTTNRSKILTPIPLQEFMVQYLRPALLVLQGAVVLVLIIICVNLANLQLVRLIRRQSQMALRLALGGTRANLAVQPFTETLALGLVGVPIAHLLAHFAIPALNSLSPVQLPLTQSLVPNMRVFWTSAACALLISLVVACAPIAVSVRRLPGSLLQNLTRRTSPGRGQRVVLNSIVVAEVALAFFLMVAAGLLVRTLSQLQAQELGFEKENLLAVNLVLPTARYPDIPAQSQAFSAMLDSLQARPGVASASFVIGAPLAGFGAIGNRVRFKERPDVAPGDTPGARLRPVLGSYFETVSIDLLQGRRFSQEDGPGNPPVAIVNEHAAQSFWPGESPLGKELALGAEGPPRWLTVVGVVNDVRSASLTGEDTDAIYLPYLQRDQEWQYFGTLLIQHRASRGDLDAMVRSAIWEVDPALPIQQITPVDELVEAAMSRETFVSWLLGAFALVATVMALQGVYAVIRFRVAEQTREIGIRRALGATENGVVRLLMARGLTLVLGGLAIGAVGAALLTRFLADLLFQVSPHDPATFSTTFGLLLLVSVGAMLWPALEASRVSPARTLQAD